MFDRLFRPRSVAVIGASRSPDKIGSKILANLAAGGYAGRLIPVNPSGGEMMGLAVAPRVTDIDGEVDLACVAVPAPLVEAAVRDCAAHSVKHLAIITSGFAEIGELELERRVVAIAREAGARVLGPNIFGVYSAAASMNATFGPRDIAPGHVAIITQSGALGIAMMGKTHTENIGLSAVVSVGNKSDVDEADLLGYLVDDEHTRVILMYIEGVRDGAKLVEALPRAVRRKPVIVIKSGRSRRGALAAASHTGSLAGADEVFSAIMRQCGALRAESIEQALEWCRFLSLSPPPRGDRTVIVTNGGGIGVLATDACEADDVPLYDDDADLATAFRDCVPEFGSLKNPIDITGGGQVDDYDRVIGRAIEHPNIDSVVVLGCETAVLSGDTLDATLRRAMTSRVVNKPVVFSFVGGAGMDAAIRKLRGEGFAIYDEVCDAISCLGAAYAYRRNLARLDAPADALDPYLAAIDAPAATAVITAVRKTGRRFLLPAEARELMRAAGIELPRQEIARNWSEATAAADRIGYPVVLKIVSPDIVHKSDAGGVALDMENRQEVQDAWDAIMHSCRRHDPRARLDGVEVVEQVAPGLEIIVGARRDPSFGPVVMFGLGGIYVEVLKDVAFRALPLSGAEAALMMRDIRSAPLLAGVRGEAPKDVDSVQDAIGRVGALLARFDDIADIEINPLMVYEQGMGSKSVDVRILLRPTDRVPDKGAAK